MFLGPARSLTWLSVGFSALSFGCGTRAVIRPGEEEVVEVEPQCVFDEDCDRSNLCALWSCVEGNCEPQPEVQCPVPRPCEAQSCDPLTGTCSGSPVTEDLDADGVRAPLPGFRPGEEGSCGSDCDDTNPRAVPGASEVCDGADNDCDGVIDNGSNYLDFVGDAIPEIFPVAGAGRDGSGSRGIAYGDGVFGLGYWARSEETLSYIRGLDVFGNEIFGETSVANVNAPSFGADLSWSGAAFGATWADPRVDDNYEVYFARFNSSGEKLGPDLRLTEADDFSIHSRVEFDQGRFVVVWDDRRDELTTGGTQVMAQLLDSSGNFIGGNVTLTEEEAGEYPLLAATPSRFGVVYTSLADTSVSLKFRTFDKEFAESSTMLTLTEQDARTPRVTAVGDLFVVTWEIYGAAPGPSIMGAVVTEYGELVLPARPITYGATHARSHDTVSLGDRFLLLWADDLDGNYELYAQVLSVDLLEIEPRLRLTDDAADTIGPQAALGDFGRVGVLFDDWRSGTHHSYFMSLGCGETPATR